MTLPTSSSVDCLEILGSSTSCSPKGLSRDLITPWSRVLLEKLTGSQLVKFTYPLIRTYFSMALTLVNVICVTSKVAAFAFLPPGTHYDFPQHISPPTYVAKIIHQDSRFWFHQLITCRSHWPRGLRRRSAPDRLLRLWVRIPPGAWMYVCRECCVLSGTGLCDELITHPEESY